MNREGTNIRKWLNCWERARLLWIRLRLRVERWSAEKGLYYIGGSDALPAPLSPEEEKQLIVQLILPEEQVVDEERMKQCQEAKTILIERNLRLVVYIAKKFENAGVNVEDLISIGTIGLIKAVNTLILIRTSNWPPTLPGVLRTKSSCIFVATAARERKFLSTNLSMWIGTEMNFCCRIFWERKAISSQPYRGRSRSQSALV